MREPAYHVVPLPARWPGKATPAHVRRPSPFRANWTGTLELLERETSLLNAKDIVLSLDVQPKDLRQDGKPYSGTRIRNPAVVLSFHSGPDRLTFPCDRFNWWEDNVRAIALALEALRKVDRYGIQQGKQYQGYKQLPASTAPTMSTARAAQVIADASGIAPAPIAESFTDAQSAVRVARKRAHPDNGGSSVLFSNIGEATRSLEAHFGRTF